VNEFLLEKEASEFRSECGFNSTEPVRLKSLLLKRGVVAVFKDLSSAFSGMALKVGDGKDAKRYMLVNSAQSVGKQHLTICHELYHLFVQAEFTSRVCITGQFDRAQDKEERFADTFAALLLLPADGLKRNIPDEELETKKLSLKTILALEQYFSCSRAALLYRLKKLELLKSGPVYDAFAANVKRGAYENGYPTDLYEPGNHDLVIGDYGVKARTLFDAEKISESHYYSLLADLGMKPHNLDEETDAAG